MAAGRCASLCSTLLFAVVLVSEAADQKIITAQSGQNVTLPCQAPNNKDFIRVVRWTKPDLQDKNVYLYRDGRFDPEEQNPIFNNRVDLQDLQMENGNVSLILKDVMTDDSGVYECFILQLAATRSSSNYITTIDLSVVDPPDTSAERSISGSDGLVVGLYVPVVLLLVTSIF